MGLAAAGVLLVVLFAYIFWPQESSPLRLAFLRRDRSRLEFLKERRDSVMENLRDLNFEFRAGKYPEQDYQAQREILEQEAATILTEMDTLPADLS